MTAGGALPVTAILPTLDEAEGLRALLPRLRPLVREIVVIDDGSIDETVAVARAFGCDVVLRDGRRGIGTCVYAGLGRASMPLIATLDADGSHPPEGIALAAARLDGPVDVVRFSRFLPGAVWEAPWRRRLLVRAVGRVHAAVLRLPLTDPTNGFTVARRDCFEGPTRFRDDPGEGWVAEFLARNRARPMVELPYRHAARRHGRSRITVTRELQRAVRSLWLAW